MKNEECNNAIKRLFSNIDIDRINEFIYNVECINKKKLLQRNYSKTI